MTDPYLNNPNVSAAAYALYLRDKRKAWLKSFGKRHKSITSLYGYNSPAWVRHQKEFWHDFPRFAGSMKYKRKDYGNSRINKSMHCGAVNRFVYLKRKTKLKARNWAIQFANRHKRIVNRTNAYKGLRSGIPSDMVRAICGYL